MSESWLAERLTVFVPVLLSLSVHEWAHAYSAFLLGDDTAEQQGRMTMNPIAHIDPLGTIVLPLLGVPFGWAKPVPVNPVRFDRRWDMGTGLALTAAAGPFSNFALAFLSVAGIWAVTHFAPASHSLYAPAVRMFYMLVFVNVALGVFNLLPIPPLDGSRVAEAFVPYRLRSAWDAYASASPALLFGVIALPILFDVSLLAWPMARTMELIAFVIGAGR
jgi:Zn-dependent protease